MSNKDPLSETSHLISPVQDVVAAIEIEEEEIQTSTLSGEDRLLFEQVEHETQINASQFSSINLKEFQSEKNFTRPLYSFLLIFLIFSFIIIAFFLRYSHIELKKITLDNYFSQEDFNPSELIQDLQETLFTRLSEKDIELSNTKNKVQTLSKKQQKSKEILLTEKKDKIEAEKIKFEKRINELQNKKLSTKEQNEEYERLALEHNNILTSLEEEYQSELETMDDFYKKELEKANLEITRLENEKTKLQESFENKKNIITIQDSLETETSNLQKNNLLLDQLTGYYNLVGQSLQKRDYENAKINLDDAMTFLSSLSFNDSGEQKWKSLNLNLLNLLDIELNTIIQSLDSDTSPKSLEDKTIINNILAVLEEMKNSSPTTNRKTFTLWQRLLAHVSTLLAGALSEEEKEIWRQNQEEYFKRLEAQTDEVEMTLQKMVNEIETFPNSDISSSLSSNQLIINQMITLLAKFVDSSSIQIWQKAIDEYLADWQTLLDSGFFIATDLLAENLEKELDYLKNDVDSLSPENLDTNHSIFIKKLGHLSEKLIPALDLKSSSLNEILTSYNTKLEEILNLEASEKENSSKNYKESLETLQKLNKKLNKELQLAQEDILNLLEEY